ncbi:exo-alpha-sialidase [candidate division KSB1 bacterium]|nr:exo-alpha-sialidase [candidate division KSB1 bacterium]
MLLMPIVMTLGLSGQDIKIEHQRGFLKSEFIYSLAERPTPQCHASTLAETERGILVAWFGGTEERHPDVGIWTSLNDGVGWSTPVEVANGVQQDGRFPCWNPVLYQAPSGPLLLFYKVGPNPREWWGMLMTSMDAGQTWSEPVRLPDGIWGPIKNKPLQLPGALLCGTSSEEDGWEVYFQITGDLGKTWTSIGPINNKDEFAAIQPTLFLHIEKKDTTLIALTRTKQGCIAEVRSKDMGKKWSPMKCTKLPNPDSGIDGVSLADGRHLLVYNHTQKGRTPLNVALSKNSKKWTNMLRLEDARGEYSYPAVIQSSDGLVHITYTWKRQTIKYVLLDPNDL